MTLCINLHKVAKQNHMFIQRRTRVSKQPHHCSLGRHALSFNGGSKSVIFTPKQDDNWGSPQVHGHAAIN